MCTRQKFGGVEEREVGDEEDEGTPVTCDSRGDIPDCPLRRRIMNSSRLSWHSPTNHELPLKSLVGGPAPRTKWNFCKIASLFFSLSLLDGKK